MAPPHHHPVDASAIRASSAFHVKVRPSPFSSEAAVQDLRGLYNLAGLTLVVMNARLVVENLLKYGLRLRMPSTDVTTWPRTVPGLFAAVLVWTLAPLAAFGVEWLAARRSVSRPWALAAHGALVVGVVLAPIAVIHFTHADVLSGVGLLSASIVMSMKLTSYAHVCNDVRRRTMCSRRPRARATAAVSDDEDDDSDESRAGSSGRGPRTRPSSAAAAAAAAAAKTDQGLGDQRGREAAGDAPGAAMRRRRGSSVSRSRPSAAADESALSLSRSASPRRSDPKPTGAPAADHPADPSAADADGMPELYVPTLGQLAYFVAAPTLIYQLSYPRTPSIRWSFAARRLFEFLFCCGLEVFLVVQYVRPLVDNSLRFMGGGDASLSQTDRFLHLAERVFKLAVPNMAVWLVGFYALFHSYLNLVGELLRFGDREFYLDWWNSEDLATFWRTWNRPVHHWMLRHVYAPALRHAPRGWSPSRRSLLAQLCVFAVSALLHELLVSVPCHRFESWAFWGMLAQVPLVVVTKALVRHYKRPVWGNLVFWASFLVFGQPLLILLYAHSYMMAGS